MTEPKLIGRFYKSAIAEHYCSVCALGRVTELDMDQFSECLACYMDLKAGAVDTPALRRYGGR